MPTRSWPRSCFSSKRQMRGSSTSRQRGGRPRRGTGRSSRGPGRGSRNGCALFGPGARGCGLRLPERPSRRELPGCCFGAGLSMTVVFNITQRDARRRRRRPLARARQTRRFTLWHDVGFALGRSKSRGCGAGAAARRKRHRLRLRRTRPRRTRGRAEAAKKKRRRGSRGGRGRKKPGATARRRSRRPTRPSPRGAAQRPRPAAEAERAQPARAAAERKSARSEQRRRTPTQRAPLPAAKRELLISVDVGEQRVAILEDDRVAEVYLERPERRSIAGNIYLGVVDNVLPGHGGGVRRDRPREERLPLRRRDRRPRARGPEGRAEDPGPDQARRDRPRPGRQGPDEVEGRAADDRDLAPRPLPRVRPERRGLGCLPEARGRGAHAAQGDRRETSTRRAAGSSSARQPRARRPRTSSATSSSCSGSGRRSRRRRRRDGAEHRLRGGGAPAAHRPRPLRGRLRRRAHRRRPHAPADRQLPEEDVAAHDRARPALPREGAAVRGARASTRRSSRRSSAGSTFPPAATSSSTTPRRSPSSTSTPAASSARAGSRAQAGSRTRS